MNFIHPMHIHLLAYLYKENVLLKCKNKEYTLHITHKKKL